MASGLPTGGVSPTGMNWLTGTYPGTETGSAFMDSFQFSSQGTTLPDGVAEPPLEIEMSREATSELLDHLEKLSPPEQYVRMVDHSWLENVQQDPKSLPKNPHVGMLESLQEAWGTGTHTNGLRIVPNKGPVRKDWNGFDPGPHSWLPQDQIRGMVVKASRELHFGKSWEGIETSLKDTLGPAVYAKVASHFKPVSDDYGLAGNVFVRADHFPGILTGKLDKVVRKFAGAQYLLVAPEHKHLQRVGHLKVVTEVPWEEALSHYLPRLRTAGIKVATGATSKETLRLAFLSRAEKSSPTMLPTYKAPSQQVTLEEAKQRLAAHTPEVETFRDPARVQWEAARAKTAKTLYRWVREGILARDVAHKLMATSSDAGTILSAAAELIRQSGVRNASYSGAGVGVKEWSGNTSVWEGLDLNAARVRKAFEVRDRIVRMVNDGQLSRNDANRILSHKVSPDQLMRLAIRRASSHKPVLDMPSQAVTGEFKGNLQERVAVVSTQQGIKEDPESQRIARLAKVHGVNTHEIRECVNYTQRMASSGVLGYDLNRALREKFTVPVLKASVGDIRKVRAQYESGKEFIKDDLQRLASTFNQTLSIDSPEATNDFGLQSQLDVGFDEPKEHEPFDVTEFGMYL